MQTANHSTLRRHDAAASTPQQQEYDEALQEYKKAKEVDDHFKILLNEKLLMEEAMKPGARGGGTKGIKMNIIDKYMRKEGQISPFEDVDVDEVDEQRYDDDNIAVQNHASQIFKVILNEIQKYAEETGTTIEEAQEKKKEAQKKLDNARRAKDNARRANDRFANAAGRIRTAASTAASTVASTAAKAALSARTLAARMTSSQLMINRTKNDKQDTSRINTAGRRMRRASRRRAQSRLRTSAHGNSRKNNRSRGKSARRSLSRRSSRALTRSSMRKRRSTSS